MPGEPRVLRGATDRTNMECMLERSTIPGTVNPRFGPAAVSLATIGCVFAAMSLTSVTGPSASTALVAIAALGLPGFALNAPSEGVAAALCIGGAVLIGAVQSAIVEPWWVGS